MPKGIVVDAKNDRLYWTNGRGKIQSINVNGSNFKGNFIEGLGSPHHIALGTAWMGLSIGRLTMRRLIVGVSGSSVLVVV